MITKSRNSVGTYMKNRIIWIDYIRAIACVLVIVLHTSSFYINNYGKISTLNWEVANLFDSFSRMCVPLFFMISGYFFFSDKKPKAKNFLRLIFSLLFYSLIALIFYLTTKKVFPNSSYDEFNFFSSPSFYHLWFFYPLIVIYAISYIISCRVVSNKGLILSLFFIFIIANPETANLIKFTAGLDVSLFLMIDGQFFYLFFYAVIGGALSKIKIISMSVTSLILIIVLATLSIFYLNSLSFNMGLNKQFDFYSYTSPLVFLLSITAFILLMKIGFEKQNRIISLISSNSLAIFGIHAFILAVIKKLLPYQNMSAIIMIPTITIIVLFSSLVFSLVVKKIDRKSFVS